MKWIAPLLAASLLLTGCLSFHAGPPPGQPKIGSFTRIGNETIRYVDSGQPGDDETSGKGAVVLVHGFGATLDEWAGVMPWLQGAGHRVLALDLLGHGYSGRPAADYSIAAHANRVVALANQRGIRRFSLVGHSWGSAVALAVALAVPERVRRIALYNGMFFEDQQPSVFHWARVPGMGELIYGVFYPDRQDEKLAFAFHDPERYVDQETVEAVERVMDMPGTLAAALSTVRAMEFASLEARYGTVRQPVLLLWGREDRVTPLGYGERLLNRLPDARLEVYPQCGHLPMIEAAGASTHELLRFLEKGAS